MELTPKAKRILQILLQTDQIITAQELANQINVSKRTVQRELELIGPYLIGSGVELVSKIGKGLWLRGNSKDKNRLLSAIQEVELFDAGNKEERRKRLILEILKEKELKKLYYYSKKFQVSESTISKDLESVEQWFERYDIKINRKNGNGVTIEGEESDYRKAIRAFIEENINTDFLKTIYETETIPELPEEWRLGSFRTLLDNRLFKQVIECIMEFEDELMNQLTESAFTSLIIHITIAVNRILKGDIIEGTPDFKQKFLKDEDHRLASKLAKNLEETFQIKIPGVEVFYIYLHLKGAKHEKIQWDDKKGHVIEQHRMIEMINEMIDAYDSKDAWLYKQDNEFIQGLLTHLQPTIIRLLYQMKIYNPVLDTVKREYAGIFLKCKKVAKVIEKYFEKEVPEDEIGFWRFILERLKCVWKVTEKKYVEYTSEWFVPVG